MWIGTSGGLNRYDGSSFIQYSILSQPSLSNNVVTALMQDEQGYIWIGTENGLNILDPAANTIHRFVHDDKISTSLPIGAIRAIQKTKSGHTWVLADYWLVEFESTNDFSRVLIDPDFVRENMVLVGVTEYDNDKIWLSYLDLPTVLAKRTGEGSRKNLITGPQWYTHDYAKVFSDSTDVTWSISHNGINRFNKSSQSFGTWIKNSNAAAVPNLHLHNCYCRDADDNIWQGNERGSLVKYDLQGKSMADYSCLVSTI